jgi:hypothetical protein
MIIMTNLVIAGLDPAILRGSIGQQSKAVNSLQ